MSVLSGPLVVSQAWPECTDLKTWMADILRLEGLQSADETRQAQAFFRWLRLFNRTATGGMIQAYEGNYGKERQVTDAHKNLFVYGWGYCDTHSRIAEAAWRTYKNPHSATRVCIRHADGSYHTMYRLKLDGKWAAFDARYGYYLIEEDRPDARILDWQEVGVDENILKNQHYQHRSQPFFEFFGREWDRAFLVNPAYYPSEEEWRKAGAPVECVFGDPKFEIRTEFHDMSFQLPQGSTIERYWDNTARKFYVPARVVEEPFLPSGRFYRVTESMLDGNWPKYDPNYKKCTPYLVTVPGDEGYDPDIVAGRTIGQAWGKLVYEPRWDRLSSLEAAGIGTDLVYSTNPPHLRPPEGKTGGAAIFDFYNPYIFVDATLSGELVAERGDEARIEIRTLAPKPDRADAPDRWSEWQGIHRGPGRFSVELGRARYRGEEVSIHGKYRFQVRFRIEDNSRRTRPVGLKALRLDSYFENGIMSIPRIKEGENIIHFKVRDASKLQGAVEVIYRYQTPSGEKAYQQTLERGDFANNLATYRFHATGLTRSNALIIRHR